jgi:predicted transcriptional regulator
MTNNYYLYRHLKPCGEVFYIGIGKVKNFSRAYSTHNRNKHWKNVITKYGYEVQVITKNLTKQLACELEVNLISWYGRRDLKTGILVNMTAGGEGTTDWVASVELKKLWSSQRKGELHPLYSKKRSEYTKDAISKTRILQQTAKGGNNPRALKVIDTVTQKIYLCIKDAAKELNLNRHCVSRYLSGYRKNMSSLVYLKDYVEGLVITPNIRSFINSVAVLDLESGIEYPSINKAAESLNINSKQLANKLRGRIENDTKMIKLC